MARILFANQAITGTTTRQERPAPGDKIDSVRISEYAFRYADQATIWQPERQIILKLRQLVALRKRLLNAKNTLRIPLDEVAAFQDKKLQKEMEKLNKKPIEALEKQIAEVEKKIKLLIKEDDSLKHLFNLVTSVDGVGEVVFCERGRPAMVIATNEFKLFSCPRKFACYSGVAPFDRTADAAHLRDEYPGRHQGKSPG